MPIFVCKSALFQCGLNSPVAVDLVFLGLLLVLDALLFYVVDECFEQHVIHVDDQKCVRAVDYSKGNWKWEL